MFFSFHDIPIAVPCLTNVLWKDPFWSMCMRKFDELNAGNDEIPTIARATAGEYLGSLSP